MRWAKGAVDDWQRRKADYVLGFLAAQDLTDSEGQATREIETRSGSAQSPRIFLAVGKI